MKQFIVIAVAILATACSFNTYDATPVTTGEFEDTGHYTPLTEDEIPECFTINHRYSNGGFNERFESLGEYCRTTE